MHFKHHFGKYYYSVKWVCLYIMNVDFNSFTLFLRLARITFALAVPTINGMVKV